MLRHNVSPRFLRSSNCSAYYLTNTKPQIADIPRELNGTSHHRFIRYKSIDRVVIESHIFLNFFNLENIQQPTFTEAYGSWIYNYLCNQCLSPITLCIRITFMARCSGTRYNIMWSSLSVTCDRSVVFSGYSGFLHQ